MRWPWRRAAPNVLPSEEGFLHKADRRLDLPPSEALLRFRDLITDDMEWTASRKRRFRRNAAWVRILTLGFTAASTALPLVALVTVLGALETFFNWRSRWVLMEEAQYRFNRLRDEIDYHLVSTPSTELRHDHLKQFFAVQQTIWDDVSHRWIEFRKLDRAPGGTPDHQAG
jgi:hypothetical protein